MPVSLALYAWNSAYFSGSYWSRGPISHTLPSYLEEQLFSVSIGVYLLIFRCIRSGNIEYELRAYTQNCMHQRIHIVGYAGTNVISPRFIVAIKETLSCSAKGTSLMEGVKMARWFPLGATLGACPLHQ